jgi:cytochrome c556
MITKKYVYHSSETDETYSTLNEALNCEANYVAANMANSIADLIEEFNTLRSEYGNKMAELRASYAPKLDSILTKLEDLGLDCDSIEQSSGSVRSIASGKKPVKVKVHVVKRSELEDADDRYSGGVYDV